VPIADTATSHITQWKGAPCPNGTDSGDGLLADDVLLVEHDARTAQRKWAGVEPKVEAKILELKASGDGILKISRKLCVGTSVVQRVFKQQPQPS